MKRAKMLSIIAISLLMFQLIIPSISKADEITHPDNAGEVKVGKSEGQEVTDDLVEEEEAIIIEVEQGDVDESELEEDLVDEPIEAEQSEQVDANDGSLEQNPADPIPSEPYQAKVIPGFQVLEAYPDWPDPGSIRLHKEARPTDKYAEWEIELTVEGKDVASSSDIVIVFDRSNSMYGSRAKKAKAAAKTFIHELLSHANANVRIGIVPFGTNAGTSTDPITPLTGYEGKDQLLGAIDQIQIYSTDASGGTNIQKGLMKAHELMQSSQAQQKTIVLMSDGEPTYSQRAQLAQAYSWPTIPNTNMNYNYILSQFHSSIIGTGNTYSLGAYSYNVNGYYVQDNGIATISTAKQIMDTGIDMYAIGLEVGNVPNAIYVLNQTQNKGYYQGGEDDMSAIFQDVAASISSAGTKAVTIDPLGDMFNLVEDGYYAGSDFAVSHGSVSWDSGTETFTWDMGSIQEGEKYTLTYKLALDFSKKPQGFTDYPTNKRTTLNYEDYNDQKRLRDYPIPTVQIESGRIDRIGYRVNVDGEPVNANGEVVGTIMEAEQFYQNTFADDLFIEDTYSVPADETPAGYHLHVGDDPQEVTLTNDHLYELVYFGYVKETELPAGDVLVTYIDQAGNDLVQQETLTGKIGESYETEAKEIDGYVFKEMHVDSAAAVGEFTAVSQEVIYVYEKQTGRVKIIKEDEHTRQLLTGAQFIIKNSDGEILDQLETDEDGIAESILLPIGNYEIEEVAAPEGYLLLDEEIHDITIAADETVELTITNIPVQGEIKIVKIDEQTEEALAGAVFELRDDANQVIDLQETDEAGIAVFENLYIGQYTIVERKAPSGYALLQGEIAVDITADDYLIEKLITNTKQAWQIPQTGGIGTGLYYAFGLILMGMASVMIRKRPI